MGEQGVSRGRGGESFWWAALQQAPGVGAGTMLRLARLFGSPEAAVHASLDELRGRGKLSERQARAVLAVREEDALLRRRIEGWAAQGIELISMDDTRYPRALHDLRSPPPLLYVKGRLEPTDAQAVAVVGTRSPSRQGSAVARMLGQELARRGHTIVSGLARGIDTAGHRGALEAEQGRTIAVMGCGLLRVYPPENGLLAGKVAAAGCLMAEVPPETKVRKELLLARDRIQAALSRAVIVVQAHGECGSIVTARHAVRCRRVLYGVPWEEPPFSEGWEALRAMGARPLTGDSDLDSVCAEIDGDSPAPPQERLV